MLIPKPFWGPSSERVTNAKLNAMVEYAEQQRTSTPAHWEYVIGDQSATLTTGTAKYITRAPHGLTVTEVRAALTTASSSGVVTVDINKNGASILSTKLTVDASEKTSVTAATPAVISDAAIADDDELTFDIDTAGTGAVGLKVRIYGVRA